MANTYANKGLTGKSTRKALNVMATHLAAPVLHNDRMADAKDPVNDATKSGKQAGALVIHASASAPADLKLAVAIGGKSTDPWYKFSTASVSTVTPS